MISEEQYKELAQKLKEAEEESDFYKLMADSSLNCEIYKDPNGKILYVSPEFETITGFQGNDLISGKISEHDFIHPDDLVRLQPGENSIQKAIKNIDFDVHIVRKDKLKRVINYTSKYIHKNSVLTGTRICIKDITNQKNYTDLQKTIRLAQENEARFNLISENINDVIWVYSLIENKFTYFNTAIEKISGYSVEEALQKTFQDFLTPESYQIASGVISNVSSKKQLSDIIKYFSVWEFEHNRKDGSVFPVEVSTTILYGENDIPEKIIGVTRDISQRKETEEKLYESEIRYKNLFENANDAIFIMKEDTFIACNTKTEELFGCTKDKILNSKPYEFSPEYQPDGYLSKDKAISLLYLTYSGVPQRFDWLHCRYDKSVFFAEVSLSRFEHIKEACILAIVRDITEKKENEIALSRYREELEIRVQERTDELATTNEELIAINEELFHQREELQAMLTQLNETQKKLIQTEKMASIGVLAAGIAHEINNPLNFIAGGVLGLKKMINSGQIPQSAQLDTLLHAIDEGIRRASEIVTGLGQYSRSSELPSSWCNVSQIIDNCLAILQTKLKDRITLIKNYSNAPSFVRGNEGKLHQVFINLIGNASQAIEDKGTITISIKPYEDFIEVIISDTGCGMDEHTLTKIFDPFFTTKPTGEGTGLGLFITQNILQEHKGDIHFESEPGKGSTAILRIPTKEI